MTAIPLLGPEVRLGIFAEGEGRDEDEVRDFLGSGQTEEFRSKARPNTYGVTSSKVGFQSLHFLRWVGPDGDQVRVLPS